MELSEHSGEVGPPVKTVELCGQYVHSSQHSGSHSSQWKVSNFLFISLLQMHDNFC